MASSGEWGDETTAVYAAGPISDGPAPDVGGQSLDAIFERARANDAALPTPFIFSLYVQSCRELGGAGRRPARHKEDRRAEPKLGPDRIVVGFDGQVRIDWADRDGNLEAELALRSYVSPEQQRGLPTNGRSDLYSLALTIAELFVLKRLSDGTGSINDSEGGAEFVELLRDGSRIPRELASMLLKSLAIDVEQRPFGVTSLTEDLERIGDRLGLRAAPSLIATQMRRLFLAPPSPPPAPAVRRSPAPVLSPSSPPTPWPSKPPPPASAPAPALSRPAHPAARATPTSFRTSPPPLPAHARRDPNSADLEVFASLSPPATAQFLPPPPAVTAATTASLRPPPLPSERPHSTVAERAENLRASRYRPSPPRPESSEPPPALARTLPPARPPLHEAHQQVEVPERAKSSWTPKALLAMAVVGVVAFAFLKTGAGKVFIAVAGHFGEPLSSSVTIVDGEQRCSGARCAFDVGAGVHEVAVQADGYVPQLQLIAVRAREPAAVNFRLERGSSSVKISGQPDGASLVVDGERVGKLPLQLDLSPGTHRLRFEAEHFEPEERTLDVALGETKVTDVALRPIVGKAKFDLRTPGADLALVSGSERKEHVDPSHPLDLDLSRKWTLEAKKDGYQPFRGTLDWNEETEKTFVVSLDKITWSPARHAASAPAAAPRAAPAANSPDALRAAMQRAIERDVAKPSADAAEDLPPSPDRGPIANEPCRVSFNSIPVASVFVDNTRMGTTPILKASIKPGAHVAQFVTGDSKKIKMFVCKPGELKIVAVSLNR